MYSALVMWARRESELGHREQVREYVQSGKPWPWPLAESWVGILERDLPLRCRGESERNNYVDIA